MPLPISASPQALIAAAGEEALSRERAQVGRPVVSIPMWRSTSSWVDSAGGMWVPSTVDWKTIQDAVQRYYPACDLTVMSSHFEGTANAVLESLACGVPVVATAVSDTAMILPDGRAGYVVPPDDETARNRPCRG